MQLADTENNRDRSTSPTLTEYTPLLNGKYQTTIPKELKWLILHSLPIVGTYLLQMSFQLSCIFTLGHLVSMLIY